MRQRLRFGWQIWLLLLVSIHWVGAAVQDPVRKVDFSQTPEVKELAERVRQIGNEMYPKVVELLADGKTKLPPQFDIVFRKNLGKSESMEFHSGYVKMGRTVIYLDAELMSADPKALDSTLVHEMAHVAQRYSSSVPGYWAEGMADYVCYKLGMRGTNCPVCSGDSWHFQSGYECTAAFLVFIGNTYGSNAVHQLNNDFRRLFYSDKFFAQVTGRSLDQLWADFKKTEGYTPAAAQKSEFYKSKGYSVDKAIKSGGIFAQIRRQPGGQSTLEAEAFIVRLIITGQLPGFRKGENAKTLTPAVVEPSTNDFYPVTRKFDTSGDGQPFVYNYVAIRVSKRSEWKLQRIWRTDREGNVVEEYAVPK